MKRLTLFIFEINQWNGLWIEVLGIETNKFESSLFGLQFGITKWKFDYLQISLFYKTFEIIKSI